MADKVHIILSLPREGVDALAMQQKFKEIGQIEGASLQSGAKT
ncbi:MAG: hypothetical protein AB7U34_10735 [Novosphingobium sp.]